MFRRYLGQFALLAILVAGVAYFIQHPELFQLLKSVPAERLVIPSLLMGLFFLVTGLTFNTLLAPFNCRPSILETAGLTFISNLASYVLPFRTGTGVKAIYLKNRHTLAYSHFVTASIANALVLLGVAGMVGMVGLLSRRFIGLQAPLALFLVCALATLAVFALPVIRLVHGKWGHRLQSLLHLMLASIGTIAHHRRSILLASVWTVIQFLLGALITSLTFQALSIPLDFTAALLVGTITTIANFFTITPGNIGVQEAVMGMLSNALGLSFEEGLAGATLLRLIHVGVCCLAAPFVSLSLIKEYG